jgi:hypothetical protein
MCFKKFDLHIHSAYSYDSFMGVDAIIRTARKRGLDGIAIIDHNTIAGGIAALKANHDSEFQVIVGAEIKTDRGDVAGLFLNEEILSRQFDAVIDEIKLQCGLSVLVHPYRGHLFPLDLARDVDFIEGFNARTKREDNLRAYELGLQSKKPLLAGSDAHTRPEIGRGIVRTEHGIKSIKRIEETRISGDESPYYLTHGLSVGMERLKKWLGR